jgi:hypothetical protein
MRRDVLILASWLSASGFVDAHIGELPMLEHIMLVDAKIYLIVI